MTNQGYFDIRETLENHRKEAICPSCGDKFTASWMAVHNVNNVPICDMCAWETAPRLANLLFLSNAFDEYAQGGAPAHILEALRQRESDPKRLKRKLQEAHARLDGWDHNSLGELLKGQIKAALASADVETMRKAERLVLETERTHPHFYTEIPF